MEHSFKYRTIGHLAKKFKRVLKPLSKLYLRYRKISKRRVYHTWAVDNERQCFIDNSFSHETKFSIVSAVYNTDPAHLREMIYSVINQHYQNWELILVNVSDQSDSSDFVMSCTDLDSRIKIIKAKNIGISENTNVGIASATGDYIVFIDHDDTLHPCAIHTVASEIRGGAEIVYTDEDKISHDGKWHFQPLCKPDWSPSLFENLNYINHLTVINKDLINKVGGLRSECNGSQDYDLLWRVIDKFSPKIVHIPRVLYHWRAAKTSTATSISNKSYIFKAGIKTLEDHFKRQKIDVKVESMSGKPGFYRVHYPPVNFSLIIGSVELSRQPAAARWVERLANTQGFNNYELIIGDWYLKYASKRKKVEAVIIPKTKDDYIKDACNRASHEVIVVCNEAVIPITNTALNDMASVASVSESIVQPLIIGPDGTVIDAGFVDSRYGIQPLFNDIKIGDNTFFGDIDWVRDIRQVSGLIYAAKKAILDHGHTNNMSRVPASVNTRSILWAHSVCEYVGPLEKNMSLPTFNPLLSQAMNEITMSRSGWDQQMEREDE